MKIAALQVRCVQAPMPQPHRTASGTVSVSPLVLLTLATDAGVSGHSIVFSYSPAALKPLGELMKNMEPLVAGQVLAPAALSDRLHARFRLLGTHGLVGMALAGIDMALWDAQARALGQPLCALLGAAPRPVPAYGGIGYDGAQASASAAEALARQGFKAVKAKIGYPTLEEDLAVVRAMRAAAGPGVAIMVDYNQSLPPAEALGRLQALDGEGLAWVEEPVLAHDFHGLAALARRVRTPLQAGENWWGPQDFENALRAGAGPLAMPDAMKCGGVTGWQRIAALGQAQGLSLSSHLWPEVSAQLLCATPTAHWLEYVDWWNIVLKAPLEIREGLAYPSTGPGSGVEFDDAAVQRYLT
ncbi:enolase C-terminal domain-like protein [Ramlibacter solisilvae]|uniref:Mandelate racemase n=1 Tax=Ramlibacter tataouinensis TaxID=94132 RepID=A0A127JSY6_9BURK|nr:enolase C-terminal domain-like protein [Ramlibacter tataouinensis]AMO23074.1 mandelate racemase [Ramlibacter tataouinensis]